MTIGIPNAPVKIAYVLPGLARGGAEKNVFDLAARLDRRRFLPCVVSVTADNPLEEEFRRLGVPVHLLPYPSAGNDGPGAPRLARGGAFLLRLRALLARERIAVVHSWLPLANIAGSLAGALAGTPVRIVTKVALCHYKKGHPVYSAFEDAANLASGAVVANSDAVADDVAAHERFCAGKLRVIRNGIAAPAGAPLPIGRLVAELSGNDGAAVAACVANFHRYKGHSDLVAAARTVADAVPGARFLLVGGDAGEMATVRRQAEALGLARHVLFAGSRADAAAIVGASAFLVHPSHEEGFSNVILEAMAAGKAVVATRVGGNPEAVEDGRTGLLVPPGQPAPLAEAILALLRDPARAAAMGAAGRERALREFSIERMTAAFEALYAELLGSAGR